MRPTDKTESTELPSSDRFEIIRRVGAGGFGAVYEARERESGQRVALKTLLNPDPHVIFRFKQEFRSLADIVHPNLVHLHELLCEHQRWLLAMEFVEGVNFVRYVLGAGNRSDSTRDQGVRMLLSGATIQFSGDTELESVPEQKNSQTKRLVDGAMTPQSSSPRRESPLARGDQHQRLLSALRQLVEGVHALHTAGRLHCDLKPSNVLVEDSGRVVVLDFGLVKNLSHTQLEPQTLSGFVAGTPLYMSPEQSVAEELTTASDWYSVGAMLFTVLTGAPPHSEYGMPALLYARRADDGPAPSQRVDGVPEALDALCQAFLRRDPQRRPDIDEILARLDEAGAAHVTARYSSTVTQPRAPTVFVGREQYLEALSQAFSRCLAGAPVTRLVHGPSGIGKSALLRHFLQEVLTRDAVALIGRCYQQESVPYKAFDGIMDSLVRYLRQLPAVEAASYMPRHMTALAQLFPVLRRVEALAQAGSPRARGGDLRQRALHALRELLTRLTDRRPVVLAMDDLQWCDSDSVSLLQALLEQPDAPPLLVLGSYRSDELAGNAPLQALLDLLDGDTDLGDCGQLALAPLSEVQTQALVRALVPESALVSNLETIFAESAGHPYFARELALVTSGADVSLSLDEALRLRAQSELSERAHTILRVVAVHGEPLEQTLASEAAGLERIDRRTLSELSSGGFLRLRTGDGRTTLETVHDRVREAIRDGLDADARRRIHLRLAETLARNEDLASPEQLAAHFQAAGDIERALDYAARAAHSAMASLAFDRAATLYAFLLEHSPETAPSRRTWQIARADALAEQGRSGDAARAYLRAAVDAPSQLRISLEREAAVQFLSSGHLDKGLQLAQGIVEDLDLNMPSDGPGGLSRFLGRRLWVRTRGLGYRPVQPDQVSDWLRLRIDTVTLLAQAFSWVSISYSADLITQLLLLCLKAGSPELVALGLTLEAFLDVTSARSGRLLDKAERLLGEGDTTSRPLIELTHAYVQAYGHYNGGRWRECIKHLERCQELDRDGVYPADIPHSGARESRPINRTTLQIIVTAARGTHFFAQYYHGHLGELAQDVPMFVKSGRARANLNDQLIATFSLNQVMLAADEPDRADRECKRAFAAAERALGGRSSVMVTYWRFITDLERELYRGDIAAARACIDGRWKRISRALIYTRVAIMRWESLLARSRCEVMAAQKASSAGLRAARKLARPLSRLPLAQAVASGCMIRAGIEALGGHKDRAAALLERAVEGFENADTLGLAHAARRSLGLLRDDRALIEDADSWLRAQSVVNPARWSASQCPGNWSKS